MKNIFTEKFRDFFKSKLDVQEKIIGYMNEDKFLLYTYEKENYTLDEDYEKCKKRILEILTEFEEWETIKDEIKFIKYIRFVEEKNFEKEKKTISILIVPKETEWHIDNF